MLIKNICAKSLSAMTPLYNRLAADDIKIDFAVSVALEIQRIQVNQRADLTDNL